MADLIYKHFDNIPDPIEDENKLGTTPEQQEKQTSQASWDSFDDFAKDLKLDYTAKPYYNKDREKLLKGKQKAALIADALRLMGQASFGRQGMHISKNPENQVMKRTSVELEKMRDLQDADIRRSNELNMRNKIQNARLDYQNQLRNAYQAKDWEYRKRFADSQAEKTAERDKIQHGYRMEQIDQAQNNPQKLEYQKQLIELQTKRDKALQNARTEGQIKVINAQYEKEKKKIDYMNETGFGTGSNRTVLTIPGGDNNEKQHLNQMQVRDMAFEFIQKMINERDNKPADQSMFWKLPNDIATIVNGGTPTDQEARYIVRYLYPGAASTSTSTNTDANSATGSLLIDEDEQTGSLLK